LEAIRQLRNELGKSKTLFIHLTLIPYINTANEFKTKPTQHSVKELLSVGIQPDLLICRTTENITKDSKQKISLFCNLPINSVVNSVDVDSIYEVPQSLYNEKIHTRIFDFFNINKKKKINLSKWNTFNKKISNVNQSVKIAIVGKYINLSESYKSLNEALFHSGVFNNVKVNLSWIDAVTLKNQSICKKFLSNYDGILVPGGFGERGALGKINAIKYSRLNKTPFLGICFGMQLAVIESARNIKGYEKASSTEFGKSELPIISLISEWTENSKIFKLDKSKKGGSMRLGSYQSVLTPKSRIYNIYKKKNIYERHRHRYEVNYEYLNILEKNGVVFSGMSPDMKLAEAMELKNHPWFLGVQFHPELKSTPFKPHPIFNSFIKKISQLSKNK